MDQVMRNFKIELHYFATAAGKADVEADQKLIRAAGFQAVRHLRAGSSPQLVQGRIVERPTHILYVTNGRDEYGGCFDLPYKLVKQLHHIDDDASWSYDK